MAVVGRSMTTLQVMVAVLGAVAVVASYLLLRSFLSRGWSAFCCAILVVGPLFGALSVSYMTDVPAYCFESLTLLVGWRAVSRPTGLARLAGGKRGARAGRHLDP